MEEIALVVAGFERHGQTRWKTARGVAALRALESRLVDPFLWRGNWYFFFDVTFSRPSAPCGQLLGFFRRARSHKGEFFMHKTQTRATGFLAAVCLATLAPAIPAGGNVVTDWNTSAISVIITKAVNRRGASQPSGSLTNRRCL